MYLGNVIVCLFFFVSLQEYTNITPPHNQRTMNKPYLRHERRTKFHGFSFVIKAKHIFPIFTYVELTRSMTCVKTDLIYLMHFSWVVICALFRLLNWIVYINECILSAEATCLHWHQTLFRHIGHSSPCSKNICLRAGLS